MMIAKRVDIYEVNELSIDENYYQKESLDMQKINKQ